ncbi:unnamed protein product [Cylindrotheca closterium]|uniref:Acyl carrier protein n=1 Tax=Cylindrotheca closterium TaxID=2856 RepID=A0AAD2JN98_9STRA|nr:unnamed protein product [Cylindrotheca closterium]
MSVLTEKGLLQPFMILPGLDVTQPFSRTTQGTAPRNHSHHRVSIAIPTHERINKDPMVLRTFAAQTFLDAGDVTSRILEVVKNFDQVDGNKVTEKVKFTEDLGLDSLDVVEVVMAIEDEFAIEIPDAEADKIVSIADAVDYIISHPMAK